MQSVRYFIFDKDSKIPNAGSS